MRQRTRRGSSGSRSSALILLLTPTGRALSPRWRLVARVQAGAGVAAFLLAIPSGKPLGPAVRATSRTRCASTRSSRGPTRCRPCASTRSGCGLIASGVSLLLRFRRARGDERRQLLWLVFAVAPLPLYVVLAFVSSHNGADMLTIVATGGFITLIPIAAGLSVLRYRLYDVERIVAATVTWVLLTTILVGDLRVRGLARRPGGPDRRRSRPTLAATVGAVAAAGLAFPLRRALQDQVDRRFNRRAYDARRVIGAALAAEDAGHRRRGGAPRRAGRPGAHRRLPRPDGAWLRADGSAAAPGAHVDVDRHGRVVARIGFDPERTDADAVRRAARARRRRARQHPAPGRAGPAGRRDRRVPRAGSPAPSARERRRIERDLHDGAQQRLLALAFELQSAQLNGDPERMRQALADGADSARTAVRELRDLANGLHPAALDGRRAARRARRHGPALHRAAPGQRRRSGGSTAALEFTAWSVIGEAVVNAQKHAGASAIEVDVARRNGHLRLGVRDDGRGGANPDGPGLRGLRDRVEAARGELSVTSRRRTAPRSRRCCRASRDRRRLGAAPRRAGQPAHRGRRRGGRHGRGRRAARRPGRRARSRTSPWSTSGCRRRTPTRAPRPRSSCASGTPDLGILLLSQSLESRYVTDLARHARPRLRLPAQGPGHRRQGAARRARLGRAPAAPCSTPRWSATCSAATSSPTSWRRLSEREREVLELMAQGLSNRAIAERLVIDVKTVETHIARILTKLDLHQTPDEHRRVLAVLAWLRG